MTATDKVAERPWQSLTSFYASTTFSEKVGRVVNNVLFSAAVYSVYALASGNVKHLPRSLYYIFIAWAVRKIAEVIVGYCTYFAIYKSQAQLQEQEKVEVEDLKRLGYSVQRISLNKSGITYKAMIVTHPTIESSGKWCLNALGNDQALEDNLSVIAQENFARKCNTLVINGPAVGGSFLEKLWVFPTRYQFGAGFEAGLQLLEKIVQATHITIRAHSLGNGMVSEGILQHAFQKEKVAYLLISDRTFSRLSVIARIFIAHILGGTLGIVVGSAATLFCYLSGAELDGIAAAKKWTASRLPQIMTQHGIGRGTDNVIPDDAGLAKEFPQEGHTDKCILLSEQIRHNGFLPTDVLIRLNPLIDRFLQAKSQMRFQ
jgi:hypothetical protein